MDLHGDWNQAGFEARGEAECFELLGRGKIGRVAVTSADVGNPDLTATRPISPAVSPARACSDSRSHDQLSGHCRIAIFQRFAPPPSNL